MRGSNKLLLAIGGICVLLVSFRWFLHFTEAPHEFSYSGKVDECSEEVPKLKQTNDHIQKILNDISNTTFFRIFRVNLDNDCPLWAREAICKEPGDCTVCRCNEDEIPSSWKMEKSDPVNPVPINITKWETQNLKNIEWHVEDNENQNGVYVDLKKNPEKSTGFQGRNVWKVIYSENCFKGPVSEMCNEERLLYKLISGLHASITTQISEFYYQGKKLKPNTKLFFDSVGNYDDRIKNLYFAYSFIMRAINRAQEHIETYNYDTGNKASDLEAKNLLKKLFEVTKQECNKPFDEGEFFSDVTKKEVRDSFVAYFHNISRILDCVDCETCKVYSKLQTYGLAAGLKILFSEKLQGTQEISLKRNELIALINTFHKFSTSIIYVDKFFDRRRKNHFYKVWGIFLSILVCCVGIWSLWKAYNKKLDKLDSQKEKAD